MRGLWSQELHVQRELLAQAQGDRVATQVGRRHGIQVVVGLGGVDVEELVVQPVDAVHFGFSGAIWAVVGVVQQVESAKLHVRACRHVRVGGLPICTCHPGVGATTSTGTTHIAMGPVHVKVAHLGVVAFGQHAAFRVGDDDLEAVLEVALVVVVADVDEVHVDRVVGPLPLDLPHRADVRVLPISCDLVVLGCGEPCRGPVDDVATERDLAFGVDVEVAVRVAVQLKLPWVRVGADWDWF